MTYAAHDILIAPARPRAQIWRLLAGLGLIAALYFALLAGYFIWQSWRGAPTFHAMGRTPWSAMELLLTFAFFYPGIVLAVRVIHRRSLGSLFGPWRDLWRDAGRAALVVIAVYALSMLSLLLDDPAPQPNLPLSRWLTWLLPAVLALVIQITSEELLFRGYLQSQLAARFASPWIWLVLPALCFALMHFNPQEAGANAPWLLLPPFAFGLVAADLTARAGNLGPALTIHFLNNFAAIMIVAPGDMLSGLSLLRLPMSPQDPAILDQIPTELMVVFILWLSVRLVIRK